MNRSYRLSTALDVDDLLMECVPYAIRLANEKYHFDPPITIYEKSTWGPLGSRIDTIYEAKTDSVVTIQEVPAKLTWWQQTRLHLANIMLWVLGIAAIYGGGLGNVIDRVRLGYVVDMIEVDFIDFPVFNVADCFITCGAIALIFHLVFFNKAFWKDEKK